MMYCLSIRTARKWREYNSIRPDRRGLAEAVQVQTEPIRSEVRLAPRAAEAYLSSVQPLFVAERPRGDVETPFKPAEDDRG